MERLIKCETAPLTNDKKSRKSVSDHRKPPSTSLQALATKSYPGANETHTVKHTKSKSHLNFLIKVISYETDVQNIFCKQ